MKLLVITHWPAKHTSSRAIELAKEMAKHVPVCWLDWDTSDISSPHRPVRLMKRFTHALRKRYQGFTRREVGGIEYLTMPYLLAKPYSFLSDDRVWAFNRNSLVELMKNEGITHVFNANATFFPTYDLDKARVVYDVVDFHPAVAGDRYDIIDEFMKKEVNSAAAAVSISHALHDLVKKRYGIESVWIPNGGNPLKFQGVTDDEVREVKKRWGLEGKKVIGCVGNHSRWAGLDLMLEAFKLLKQTRPDAALFIVGPGIEVDAMRSKPLPDDVILTGPIPPDEIGPYFQALDVGALPFTQEPFTDNALPIKIIEYGFAKKPVVASPLKELCTLAFPHVKLVERTPEEWSTALNEALSTDWQDSWDIPLKSFTWKRLARKVLSVLEGK